MFTQYFDETLLLVCNVDKFFCISLRADLVGQFRAGILGEDRVFLIGGRNSFKFRCIEQVLVQDSNHVFSGVESLHSLPMLSCV